MDAAAGRAANEAVALEEVRRGAERVASGPLEVYFSAEHRCTLRCIMCRMVAERRRGVGPAISGPAPGAALARLQKLSPLAGGFRHVRLTGYGETLLAPDLPEMLRLAGRGGAYTSFATNGLLIDEATAAMLVDRGLGLVVVSVDAATADTYERVREGARWTDLMAALRTLARVKALRSSTTPVLYLSGNFARYNAAEMPGLVDVAAAVGAEGVYLYKTMFFDPTLVDQDLSRTPRQARQLSAAAHRRAARHGIRLHDWIVRDAEEARRGSLERAVELSRNATERLLSRIRRGRRDGLRNLHPPPELQARDVAPPSVAGRCHAPWTGIHVQSDGSVRACCAGSILLGDLDRQPLADVRNGAPARMLRRLFAEGRPPEGCLRCPEMSRSNDLPRNGAVAVESLLGHMDHPAEGERLEGASPVEGWLADAVTTAEILVDGEVAGVASTMLPRPDVAHAYPQLGREVGFSGPLDAHRLEPGYHLLWLRTSGRDGAVRERFHRTILV